MIHCTRIIAATHHAHTPHNPSHNPALHVTCCASLSSPHCAINLASSSFGKTRTQPTTRHNCNTIKQEVSHLLRQFVVAALRHELGQLLLGDEVGTHNPQQSTKVTTI
jgi:hypothetical protein